MRNFSSQYILILMVPLLLAVLYQHKSSAFRAVIPSLT